MNDWNNYDRKSLNSALELDRLRLRRENIIKDLINFQKIYDFTDKLSEHQKTLAGMLSESNYPSYYLFGNPLVDGIMDFYGVSLEDYKKAKRTKCSDFVFDIKTGLDMIIESFEKLDSAPTIIPIPEIEALRDFCLTISKNELKQMAYFTQYRLAA